ncbi:MAG: VOC family protein [Acidimicrobiia bacterium]|nr:VOC family protein [Acidimicrobiia bacterium]
MSREIRVTTVMHDTVDLDQAVDFWTSVLGIEVLERAGNYVYLGRLGEDAPHLAFQLVPEEKQVKNRLHLDIKVPDRVEFVSTVEGLGGRRVVERQEGDFPAWIVMADPQGNEFCIYDGRP